MDGWMGCEATTKKAKDSFFGRVNLCTFSRYICGRVSPRRFSILLSSDSSVKPFPFWIFGRTFSMAPYLSESFLQGLWIHCKEVNLYVHLLLCSFADIVNQNLTKTLCWIWQYNLKSQVKLKRKGIFLTERKITWRCAFWQQGYNCLQNNPSWKQENLKKIRTTHPERWQSSRSK